MHYTEGVDTQNDLRVIWSYDFTQDKGYKYVLTG